MNYTAYHVHSDYSLLDSCTKFEDYVDLAVQLGQTAIASTEHGRMIGWVEKKMYCDKKGIKFIHGVEIYLTEHLAVEDPETGDLKKIRDNYHTILLAKNQRGVRELNKLVSMSCDKDHFYYTNRISFDEFLEISDNIISTSACLASPLNKLPEDHPMYMRLAQKYTFFEIQPHDHPEQVAFNRKLFELSKTLDKPLIAGTDTHSLNSYKAECRSILMSAKRKNYGDEDAFDMTYKTYEDLAWSFKNQGALPDEVFMEAIHNTNVMADMCENFELDTSIKYPILYGSPEKDEFVFEELAWSMLDEKLSNGIIPKDQESAFRESIEEELRVFKKLGMSGFMLSMSELIRWCKINGMAIGTARGSVGGSRVAYVTDIIDLNPEQWKTVFSRFANEHRQEIGDIDIDCVDGDRPAIFNHIINKFGVSKTARVASYGTLAERSVIEAIGRGFRHSGNEKYSIPDIDKVKNEFDSDPDGARRKYPDIFYYFDGLAGTKVSQSVHPAGMVICPIDLDEGYGVFDKDGERCLMLNMEEAHEVGLAKYDFLVLRNVEIIRDACEMAGIQYPQTYQIDFDDEKVWADMLRSPVGIFQMESKFAFDCLKKMCPKSIFDMSLVTASIRPSGTSYRDELLARKKHKNPSELIDKLLEDNGGWLVYQEDTIAFLQQLCGLSGGEADNVRRAIGRKQKDRLDAALPAILDGYCSKANKPRQEAEEEAKEFIQILEDSAEYQFGKNHSIAYCILGFFCAWLRCYYPLEFITSLLNNAANDDDIRDGTRLARLYGIAIKNPKWGVSRSDYFYDKEKKVVAKGLSSIKFIGPAVAEELYQLSQAKQYRNFSDLLYDVVNETTLDSRQLEILIKIDFFSEFGNQRELFAIYDLFSMFKQGSAKQIKKESVDGTQIEYIVKQYSRGKTKTGKEAKSYTLVDTMGIVRGCEKHIKSLQMNDLGVVVKARNFAEVMGYAGYSSGDEADRNKLYIKDVFPVKRRADGVIFAYNVLTQSLGSGIESSMTVFKTRYERDPIKVGEVIACKRWERDGKYFRMLEYEHIYT